MRKKVISILIIAVGVAGLLLAAHLLVNNLNLVDVIKSVHGG